MLFSVFSISIERLGCFYSAGLLVMVVEKFLKRERGKKKEKLQLTTGSLHCILQP